jgi:hypothetical protein
MGLGEFLDQDRVRKQLKLIFERNVQPENEVLVNGSYPDGHFLDEFPFAQWQTPWTGTEYFYVLQCYRAGLFDLGDRVVEMVYDRHVREGMRWDQAECSNHYSRPLSIWGAYMARVGLEPDALHGALKIAPAGDQNHYKGACITATGLGQLEYRFAPEKSRVSLELKSGELRLKQLRLKALAEPANVEIMIDGQAVECSPQPSEEGVAVVEFAREHVLTPNGKLNVTIENHPAG